MDQNSISPPSMTRSESNLPTATVQDLISGIPGKPISCSSWIPRIAETGPRPTEVRETQHYQNLRSPMKKTAKMKTSPLNSTLSGSRTSTKNSSEETSSSTRGRLKKKLRQGQRLLMDVRQVMCMKGGVGQNSYTSNSSVQKNGISQLKHLIREAVLDLYSTAFINNLAIADLGCSSGPNTLMVISQVIGAISESRHNIQFMGRHRPPLEILVYLNDLPGNDFNTIFQTHMRSFNETMKEDAEQGSKYCFIAGMPGSFYGRLFPASCLHFVHSSYSVPAELDDEITGPVNKGKIYIGETSPPCVFEAYLKQFQTDFSKFLSYRAEEMVPGGRMVLSFAGRKSGKKEYCYTFRILTQALHDMVSQGFILAAKLDSFNLPYYSPSVEELKEVINSEGSFFLNRIETFEVVLGAWVEDRLMMKPAGSEKEKDCKYKIGSLMEKGTRAMTEQMLGNHFGVEILDKLFQRFREIASERWREEQDNLLNIGVSLTRKHSSKEEKEKERQGSA